MPSTDERLAVTTDLDPGTLHGVIRHGLVVGVLLLIGALVTVLPGGWRELPGTGVSVEALLSTTVALAVVATLLLALPAVGALVRAAISGPPTVVDDLAGAARHGLVFAAVLVAYVGLLPTVGPLLPADALWTYDVAFLGAALFPVAAIGRRLYRSADPVSRALSESVVETWGADRGEAEPGSGG